MSNSQPLISILIPCYNAAPWLHRCLDSVLAQTYTNWEAILVNDGSFKDNTAEILEEYAAKDARFKVIHQENRGLSGARNTGLRHMTGEWMTWVDADDAILPGYVGDLFNGVLSSQENNKSCDMVISKVLSIKEKEEGTIVGGTLSNASYNASQFVPDILPKAIYGGRMNLYNVSFIREHNITFNEAVAYAEDYLFNQECIAKAKCINTISAINYLYYIRESADSVHKVRGTIAQEMALFSDRLRLNRALRLRFPHEATTLGRELANTLTRVLNAIFLTPHLSRNERIAWLEKIDISEEDLATTSWFKQLQHRYLIQHRYKFLRLVYQCEQQKVRLASFVRKFI